MLDHIRIELAHRQIIEKKQRLRALHQNVVDAVIHQISADRGVHAGSHGHFELGADTVRAGNEHRLFPSLGVQREKSAKSSDSAKHSRRKRPARVVADALLRCVGDGDVHSGIGVFH